MKVWLRRHFPWLYYRLWRLKDWTTLRTQKRFHMWFDSGNAQPNRCAAELAPFTPAYVDTVLVLGCSTGRDFIPFQDHLNLWGIDLAPYEDIEWKCKTDRLRYETLSVEAFIKRLETSSINLSRTIVYGIRVLCYISAGNQGRLLDALRARGCRNIIFEDYPPDDPQCGERATGRCFHLLSSEFGYHLCFKDPETAHTWAILDNELPSEFIVAWQRSTGTATALTEHSH